MGCLIALVALAVPQVLMVAIVLLTDWFGRGSWSEWKVFVSLSRELMKQSPQYTEDELLNRDYETTPHRQYICQGYWSDDPVVQERAT